MRRIEAGALDAGGDPHATALARAARRDGAWLEDHAGRRWLDLVNADGAVLLGWNDPGVETAAADPRPADAAEAAARLCALLPDTEAVSLLPSVPAALAAVLLAAKTLTGRDGAFFCDEACSAADDRASLARAFARHGGRMAAVVIRPLDAPPAYLAEARRLADAAGALLVFEESRTAFRVHAAGAQGLSGVRADAVVCGPSLANGRPLAAVAGAMELMRALRWDGPPPPAASVAAACAVLRRLEREDAAAALRVRGAEIAAEVEARLAARGLQGWLRLYGDPCWSVLGGDLAVARELDQALLDRGVLTGGAHVPSLAFGEAETAALLDAYDAALPAVAARAARLERLAG